MKKKKQLTHEQEYEKNKKRARILKRLAPICFWGMLGIAALCLIGAIRYSIGNVLEILRLLDNKVYTGEQLQTNYQFLIQKYGEVVMGNGGMGFQVKFVDIGAALFSKLMIFYFIVACINIVGAYVIGKWTLPKIAKRIDENNQDMVNITVLRNQDEAEKDVVIE